jgi:ATP-dependent DNA ligase
LAPPSATKWSRRSRRGLALDHRLQHRDVGEITANVIQDDLRLVAVGGDIVFRHACKLGYEGIVSKRLGSRYRSGRSKDWIKTKNPAAPAVKREAEEDWGKGRRR